MFRFMLKYTPLLKRSIICVLVLLLFMGCFVKPLTVNAMIAYDPASSAIWAAFKIWDLIPAEQNVAAKLIAAVIDAISDKAGEGFIKYKSLLKLLSSLTGNSAFKLTQDDVDSIKQVIVEDVVIQGYLGMSGVQSADEIPIYGGVQMYVPTEEAMQNTLSITDYQILYQGFIDETVSELQTTNFILSGISDYLTTAMVSMLSWQRTLNTTLTERLSDMRYELYLIHDELDNRLHDIRQELFEINKNLTDRLTTLHESIRNLKEHMDTRLLDIRAMQATINDNLTDRLTTLHESIRNLKDHMDTRLLDIRAMQTTINDNLTDRLKSIREMQSTINQNLTDRLKSIRDMMSTMNSNLTNRFKSLEDTFTTRLKSLEDLLITGFPSLKQSLDQIAEKIPAYDDQIEIVQKPQIQVQVGQQQILVQDYATMTQAFSAKMSWVPQIFDFLAELRSRLNSGTPPKIALNLSAAEGSIDWGDDAYILDMSWYARYKPSVDTILSGIMWLCFGWAIYKRIPDILSGVGLTVENATQEAGHVWSDRAERAASLAYRQERRSEYYDRKSRGG